MGILRGGRLTAKNLVDTGVFAGRRILITGAAGSVGAALSQRLAAAPDIRLGLLDHADHGLIRLADELGETSPGAKVDLLLCSVRDPGALARTFDAFAPEIVIHAAALKHVHLGEAHPIECVLTNLIGARNVVAAAHAAGAGEFLLISSDKAAAPTCVMGAAKRLAELYLYGFAMERRTPMRLAAVRFGNVMGSQGSVAPRFAEQIERGGPVTLTHPDMERYFLTMDEAVEHILRVCALAPKHKDGAAFVMDMGEPISIRRLAEEMIARAESNAAIAITGVRPGEKLSEQLFDDHEVTTPSALEGVFAVRPRHQGAFVSAFDISELEAVAQAADPQTMRARVFERLATRLRGQSVAARAALQPV